MTHLYKI